MDSLCHGVLVNTSPVSSSQVHRLSLFFTKWMIVKFVKFLCFCLECGKNIKPGITSYWKSVFKIRHSVVWERPHPLMQAGS